MSIPSNRQEFKDYCLRKLGEPAVNVNVTPQQVDDRVHEALNLFHERHYSSFEEIFVLYNVTDKVAIVDSNGDKVLDSNGDETYDGTSDVEKGYITLPADIVSVSDVYRPKNALGLSSTEYQFHIREVATLLNPTHINSGLSYFYMYDSHLSLVNKFFNPSRTWNYNNLSHKLIVGHGLTDVERTYGGIVMRCFRTLQGETNSEVPNAEIHNIWQNRWLQNWCTALLKEQWGSNLIKYQEVALIGGVRMNGELILQQAKEDQQQLREELKSSYELPPLPFWS